MKHLLFAIIFLLVIPWEKGNARSTEEVKVPIQFIDEELLLAEDSVNKLNHFLQVLALKESVNTWDTTNTLGYVGKYQFGKAARRTVRVKDFTWRQFKANPNIWPEEAQDMAVVKLMRVNHTYLSYHFYKPKDRLFEDHFNKEFVLKQDSSYWYSKGETVRLTWAGVYAACHLAGPGNFRNYLNSNGWNNFKDDNGMSIFDYLKYFSDIEMKPVI